MNMPNIPDLTLSGSYTFYFDRDTVWEILMNEAAIGASLPGMYSMIALPDETFAWQVTTRLELAGKTFAHSGTIRLSDIEPLEAYRLNIAVPAEGIEGNVQIVLSGGEPSDDGSAKTQLNWQGTARFSDSSNEMMVGMMQMLATMLAQQFFMGLAKQLRAARRAGSPVILTVDPLVE